MAHPLSGRSELVYSGRLLFRLHFLPASFLLFLLLESVVVVVVVLVVVVVAVVVNVANVLARISFQLSKSE